MPPAAKSRAKPAPKQHLVGADDVTAAPVVLVTGAEELLAERAVAAVLADARRADPEARTEQIDASAYQPGQLAVATSPSLFGGRVVVVVSGVAQAIEPFPADALAYLAAPDPEASVVLRHTGGQRAKAVLDAARSMAAPEVSCLPITRDEDKVDFAAMEFRRLGLRVPPAALRALVDAVGSDLRELASACQQLADDAAGSDQRVDAETVDRYFGGRVEVTGFRVADAAVAGQADEALRLLRHALATGADPVPLVAALAAKVRALAKVSAAGRGRSADVARDLGLAPWQVDRARRELSAWTDAGIGRAILALAEADTAVKGGGRDPIFAVERAVLAIAAARGVGRDSARR